MTWNDTKARRILCEKYYQLMCSTMSDVEIRRKWLDVGVPNGMCYKYLQDFRIRIRTKDSREVKKLGPKQVQNFLAFHYFLASSRMTPVEIVKEWTVLGIDRSRSISFVKRLKRNNEWKKRLRAGNVNILMASNANQGIIDKSHQQEICEMIYVNRRPEITNEKIEKAWRILGVSETLFRPYMRIFRNKFPDITVPNDLEESLPPAEHITRTAGGGSDGRECSKSILADTIGLTQDQCKNFLATYYFIVFKHMSEDKIQENWHNLGIPLTECQKFLNLFKSNKQWYKNILAGSIAAFKPNIILKSGKQTEVCRFIYTHRCENITDREISAVWRNLGVSYTRAWVLRNKFRSTKFENSKMSIHQN